jgi:hypothetical protein
MIKKVKKIFKGFSKSLPLSGRYEDIFDLLNAYTMIPKDIYIANLELAEKYKKIKGAVVECGTWKGGMIAGISLVLEKDRNYYLFDSFEGLPPVKEIDGTAAKKWQSDKDSEIYFDNCTASEDDVKAAMEIAGTNNYLIEKGWFDKTLPSAKLNGGIGILRMDADWYDSTMEILNNLFPRVNKGGIIIIDDYYFWEGCSKAVHDYLSKYKRTEKIRSYKGVCYIIKD